jgi:2-oxo-4-hydroxy-4-carboxy-5-ureidoimidazoline decarboxylase
MTMHEVDRMSQDAFETAFGWIFEHSPWVAERTWPKRPFGSLQTLHARMIATVEEASTDEQVALIRAHPDLGARARMSAASSAEQSGAGLDRLTQEEFDRLHHLNSAYREKFGFPFIYAVKGSSRRDILEALDRRLGNRPEEERITALGQIYRIALFRLEETISCTTS